ncbi:AAA family ATPase [Agitococcus lubricus]|uniref:AAA15 family ATPase/GTPase n=1 Tax=Agitococcus lubricus TaxID=1077255 RepID=A0A2T5J2H2_9GAMM|nr:ATP-binding protein [Agitococcus lubricus]PTQ90720.1 AAA15 family ATPase/GTPase [Agitococcus lubricus]
MIDNLKIQNFRLFESLEIQGIKRVNLIVGKNNAGKSALLEALQLYFSGFSLDVMYEILLRRQENIKVKSNEYILNNPLKSFFKNYTLAIGHDFQVSISTNHYSYLMKIMIEGNKKYTPLNMDNLDRLNDGNVGVVVSTYSRNKEIASKFIQLDKPLSSLYNQENIQKLIGAYNTIAIIKSVKFVAANGLNDLETAQLWDSISLTSAQDDVIKAFHIIEPKLTGLSFVAADSETNSRIPIIKLRDMPEPIPLKSLGDGMTRLFHLILSLVTAKDGVLLIDEFENGLHWSTQSKAWQLIFTLAEQWNVQVFCTTHSKDCINGFEEIWTQYPQDAAFFRLYRKDNQSYIKTYDLEMLSDAIETETEVR